MLMLASTSLKMVVLAKEDLVVIVKVAVMPVLGARGPSLLLVDTRLKSRISLRWELPPLA